MTSSKISAWLAEGGQSNQGKAFIVVGLQACGLQQWAQSSGITASQPQLPWPLRLGSVLKRSDNRRCQPPQDTALDCSGGLAGPQRPRIREMVKSGKPFSALMEGLRLQASSRHQPPAEETTLSINQGETQSGARVSDHHWLTLLLPGGPGRERSIHTQSGGQLQQGDINGVHTLLLRALQNLWDRPHSSPGTWKFL